MKPEALPPTTCLSKTDYVLFFARVYRCLHHPLNASIEYRRYSAWPGKKPKPVPKFKPSAFRLTETLQSMLEVPCALL